MKKILKFLVVITLFMSVKGNALISISGPASVTTGTVGSYSATALAGYTYVWSVNNTNAVLSASGSSATLTGSAPGNVVLSLIAFKNSASPSYCASYNVEIVAPFEPCANMYRIDDTYCSPGSFASNGWRFQLVNKATNQPVNPPGANWNSDQNQSALSYFIIEVENSGYMSGHPNPLNFQGPDALNSQFSVTCTVNGCTFYYENYFGDSCGDGETGYIKPDGTRVETGN